jgi:hypothetical protein
LESRDDRFGGWSDLSVSADGTRLIAISDRGFWLEATLIYDGPNLKSIASPRLGPLINMRGRPLLRTTVADAEGLAAYPDGSFLVSFERLHRLWLYPAADPLFSIPPRQVPSPARLREAPLNAGIEGVVRLSGGRLLALTEDLHDGRYHVGWLGNGVTWDEVHYRARYEFKPTGLAEFPAGTFAAGDVLMLERRFTIIDGASGRLAHVRRGDIRPGAPFEGVEVGLLHPPLTADNFEGVAIARGPGNTARIYIISDDNYSMWQRTLLMMFELAPEK